MGRRDGMVFGSDKLPFQPTAPKQLTPGPAPMRQIPAPPARVRAK